MKTASIFLWVLVSSFPITILACETPATLCDTFFTGSFKLIDKSRPAPVVIDATADPAIQRVAQSFALDLKRVSGKKTRVRVNPKKLKKPVVVLGELGNSSLIDQLVKEQKLNVDSIRGRWEAYQIAVVPNPWPGVDNALVVAGSDRRGVIFGTYALSEQLGVSPWHWFADVPVQKRTNAYVVSGSYSNQPTVRYRGLFINDEDPALSGWAIKQFGGVNAHMYEHVFELILRLKGNYIWPAMWSKAFHVDDPRNTSLADAMGIVVGTSHHEPMTRAHAEWHKSLDAPHIGGAWNYTTNAQNLRAFWRGGIQRMMSKGDNVGYESLLTVGMRGDGDEPMSEGTAIQLLEQVVADQRKIIEEETGKPASKTPQVWALYKEVQDYYDKGMNVPDDITLLFADDNWGQIRRLPSLNQNRQGGFGVYYHFDYVGAPRNYKWLNTTQIEKVWQQMDLAHERGANNIWIVNVGDIKPMEFPLDFFLDMAWNPAQMTPKALERYPVRWAKQQFGETYADAIGDLLTRYSKYAARRKPELIDENSFAIGEATNNSLTPGPFYDLVETWKVLEQDMLSVKAKLPQTHHSAYFQLVEYPIAALSNLYQMYFATAWNRRLALHHDARANTFLVQEEKAYARDAALTQQYHQLNDGKWDGMINQVHMNYKIWNTPTQQTMPSVVRVKGGRNKIDAVFERAPQDGNNAIEIAAIEYTKSIAANGIAWTAIPQLGRANGAMVTLPQGRPPSTQEDGIRLEYLLKIERPGDLRVDLHLSPTLDTLNKGGIQIGVSLNNQAVSVLNSHLIPTAGAVEVTEQQHWVDAVINNQHRISTVIKNVAPGKHTLKIWRLDDNIVLEKIVVNYTD